MGGGDYFVDVCGLQKKGGGEGASDPQDPLPLDQPLDQLGVLSYNVFFLILSC